ncbi:MAG: flagellar protein FlaG [Gallionella sp.]|jgi:flagellar protein FlaG|nr:flagellar protein FlaG [Gallionella sp.]
MLIQPTNSQIQAPVARGDTPRVATQTTPVYDTASTVQTPVQQPSQEQLKSAVNSINHVMLQSNQSLEFSIDSSTKIPVMRMKDSNTGETIRQYPTEQALAIARSIDQLQPGLLFTQKA